MPLLYHAYVYLEFLILACTIYILAPTRLRKVAKQCVNYGRRVQNSVFECVLDNAQCIQLKSVLSDIIDPEVDSLRFYYLGNKYKAKVESIGVERGIAIDDVLVL